MSEGIIIAIIGLIGSIFGALIGAFATLQAAQTKAKMQDGSQSSNISCITIGLAASVAGVVGMILGGLFGVFIIQQLDNGSVDNSPPGINTPTNQDDNAQDNGSNNVTENEATDENDQSVELDALFTKGNWFCFPDRTNGIGVQFLPANFTVEAPLRYVDTYQGRFNIGDTVPGLTGATAELTFGLPVASCPVSQQSALSAWQNARTSEQAIFSSSQLDDLVGAGNWQCLPDYNFGAKVFYLEQDLVIKYPISTVDIQGSKHGVGETIPAGGEITIWFAGSVPRNQCP